MDLFSKSFVLLDGWSWTVESLNIIICTPFDMYLLISVRTVVSGDVGGVRTDSLRNKNNHVVRILFFFCKHLYIL
jgi:hypothetical protein